MHSTMPLKNYPIPEQPEPNGSEIRVSTGNKEISEESKMNEEVANENPEENKNMLDFIKHLDSMINKSKALMEENSRKKEEEEKAQTIAIKGRKRVMSGNLLSLNDSRDQNSVSQSSIHQTSSRPSLTTQTDEFMEKKEGWLLKRSYNSPKFIGWQRRFVVIKNQKLMYYKDEEKKWLDGVIDFNLLTCLVTVPKEYIGEDMAGI